LPELIKIDTARVDISFGKSKVIDLVDLLDAMDKNMTIMMENIKLCDRQFRLTSYQIDAQKKIILV
jgi:hypothetical protein